MKKSLGEASASLEEIVLLDNGSVSPASVLGARAVAKRLSETLGLAVRSVSAMHSSKVDPDLLEGERAWVWADYLASCSERGVRSVLIVPLFFGPSQAIASKLREQSRRALFGADRAVRIRVALPLVDLEAEDDLDLARLIADEVVGRLGDGPRSVVLADHGSPTADLGRCRDLVAKQLASILGGAAKSVVACSMERRDGARYDFNEPLLEGVLDGLDSGEEPRIVLALMFLFPGRHAGPGGDIAGICEKSRFVRSGGLVDRCAPIGAKKSLADLLARRYREAVGSGRLLDDFAAGEL